MNYNIGFDVDGKIGWVSYSEQGDPLSYSCLPGWFKAPSMSIELACAMNGSVCPLKVDCKWCGSIPITYKGKEYSMYVQENKASNRFRAITDEKSVKSVEQIAREEGFLVDNDSEKLEKAIDEVIASAPPSLNDYVINGKTAALGTLIGMVKQKCSSHPKIIRKELEEKLQRMIEIAS